MMLFPHSRSRPGMERSVAHSWRREQKADDFIAEYLRKCEAAGEKDFVAWYLEKQSLEFCLMYEKEQHDGMEGRRISEDDGEGECDDLEW